MWLQVRRSPRVLGIQFRTKAWRETWGLNLNLWSPLHPTGKNIFSLVLPQHLCSWHSGRPHMKQTKLVKLIIMPFFVVVDLSAEESTDHVSCTCLLKVSQNAGKSVLYCIHHIVWQQPQEITFQTYTSLVYLGGLSRGSSGFSVSVLLSYFSSGGWRRKWAIGNPRDMMVQRKIVPCCLPPASWISDVPARTSHLAYPLCLWPSAPTHLPATLLLPTSQSSHPLLLHQLSIACWRDWGFSQNCYAFFESRFLISDFSFGRKASIYMAKICFFSHDSYSSSPLSTAEPSVPPSASCWSHRLSLPQLCPKASSLSGHEGLSGTLEHCLILPHAGMAQTLLGYQ